MTDHVNTLAPVSLDDYIDRIVSTAPPLSIETADRIALILGGAR